MNSPTPPLTVEEAEAAERVAQEALRRAQLAVAQAHTRQEEADRSPVVKPVALVLRTVSRSLRLMVPSAARSSLNEFVIKPEPVEVVEAAQ